MSKKNYKYAIISGDKIYDSIDEAFLGLKHDEGIEIIKYETLDFNIENLKKNTKNKINNIHSRHTIRTARSENVV